MSDGTWPTYDEWLSGLDPETRARAENLTATFARLDASDPESWARSEIQEDIPQLARFLALRFLWPNAIDVWQNHRRDYGVVQRLLAAGAADEDIVQLARGAAFEAVFATLWSLASSDGSPYLHEIEDEIDIDIDELPGWTIVETRHGQPTGRVIRGLHESLPMSDPSGRDGTDLWT